MYNDISYYDKYVHVISTYKRYILHFKKVHRVKILQFETAHLKYFWQESIHPRLF